MIEVPDFIFNYVQEARSLFGVGGPEWNIQVRMTDKPGGSIDNGGHCSVDTVYMNATLEFDSELEDSPTARRYAYHEVLHVPHERVDRVVRMMIDLLPEDIQEFQGILYQEAVENFVQQVSRCIAYGTLKENGES